MIACENQSCLALAKGITATTVNPQRLHNFITKQSLALHEWKKTMGKNSRIFNKHDLKLVALHFLNTKKDLIPTWAANIAA